MNDPFSAACLAARQRVPLDPPVESTEMPETPQIGNEIGVTFGEFKGMENKEDPSSDPGTMTMSWYNDGGWLEYVKRTMQKQYPWPT